MIFGQGAWQLGLGLGFGLALAAASAQVMQVILFDVPPRDPITYASVALVLASAGLLACLIPARRATRVDPIVALRAE
jgi:ABC-type antimicrobial peptide transport system permease subunit